MDSTPVVPDAPDTRPDPPMIAPERDLLDSWVDLYRETVFHKISGLSAAQLCQASVPPSTLTLIGVVRHLTEVEAYWLREVLWGEELPDYYCTERSRDGDFEDYAPQDAAGDVQRYRDEIARTRDASARWTDLDAPARALRHGQPVNLRWILSHLAEEYARHLGHMDLIREAIDGRTGY